MTLFFIKHWPLLGDLFISVLLYVVWICGLEWLLPYYIILLKIGWVDWYLLDFYRTFSRSLLGFKSLSHSASMGEGWMHFTGDLESRRYGLFYFISERVDVYVYVSCHCMTWDGAVWRQWYKSILGAEKWCFAIFLYCYSIVSSFIHCQEEMTSALATMRVDYEQIKIKKIEDSSNPLLMKRRKKANPPEPTVLSPWGLIGDKPGGRESNNYISIYF